MYKTSSVDDHFFLFFIPCLYLLISFFYLDVLTHSKVVDDTVSFWLQEYFLLSMLAGLGVEILSC